MAQFSHPPNPRYNAPSLMMPGTTTDESHPQSTAPAPSGTHGPQTLRPMPPDGLTAQLGAPLPYGSGPLILSNRVVRDGALPTGVVGSQGRRGIWSCTTGRLAVPAAGAKHNVVHTKDVDGKYPCPNCDKSYLHAKNLKRHLLRHTGDRPYMCMLCGGDFSRSDVLKRHLQMCAVRRPNPTGLSRLSLQAQIKNCAWAEKTGGLRDEKAMNQINGLNNMPPDIAAYPIDTSPVSYGMDNKAGDGNRRPHFASDNQDLNGTGPDMGTSQPYALMFLTP